MATGELSCLVKLSCKHVASNRQSMQGKKRERTRERRRNVWQVRSAALPLGPRGKKFLSPLAIFGFLDCLGTAGVLSEEKRARFLDCTWSKLLRTD